MLNNTDTNTRNDYDDTTNDYKIIKDNCANSETKIVIIIPTLILTIPCGPSFPCLMILTIYTLIKPLL